MIPVSPEVGGFWLGSTVVAFMIYFFTHMPFDDDSRPPAFNIVRWVSGLYVALSAALCFWLLVVMIGAILLIWWGMAEWGKRLTGKTRL